jgi:hypothetical protein
MRLGVLQSGPGRPLHEKIPFTLPEIEPQIIQPVA